MSSFILSETVTMIGVQKGYDEMFMWKTSHCFVFFIDAFHQYVLWEKEGVLF